MNEHSFSDSLDTSPFAHTIGINLKTHLYKILDVVDSLYALQSTDGLLPGKENYIYKEIIRLLYYCAEFLPKDSAYKLKAQIKSIENGIYDLALIEIETSDKNSVCLIFGKIICPGNSNKYYSAVLGIEDKSFYKLIDNYKREILVNCGRIPLIDKSEIDNLSVLNNSFKCMNVIKLSGYINREHIPFSIFFSGGGRQQLSSLSNTVLFTNIYIERFRIISESMGRQLIDPGSFIEQPDPDIAEQILVLWLWGHDIGHFLKEDNLKFNIASENKYIYEVAHELRSDIFSLYLLNKLCDDYPGIKEELVYQVFVMEMFRYIRRGGFANQPDSVSAYLIFRYMLYKKAVIIDAERNKVVLNYPEFGKMIDEVLIAALDLFKSGSFKKIYSLLTTLDIDCDFDKIEDNFELDLSFDNIPNFIKII